MQYPLLHRFQGTLVGSILKPDPQVKILSELGRDISTDNLKASDWLNLYEQYQGRLSFPLSSSHLILATLPLQLRYYDHRSQLEAQLDILERIWQQPRSGLEDVQVWSYILSLACSEKLNPTILVEQILAGLPSLNTPLLTSLGQLPNLLAHSLPLHQILSHFRATPHRPILAALSCFMKTPDDAKLCLWQASQSPSQLHLTLALAGALSGAYNGIMGLPLSWRLNQDGQEMITTVAEQAQVILARWSGVYEVSSYPLLSHHALATPGIIQRRATLRIISQKEI